jgi:exonuclease VII small subunit
LRIYEAVGSAGSPEPPLLNSFYLGDLAMARDQLQRNAAARNLSLYLGAQPPPSRCDLLHNNAALAQTLRPNLIPVARWPAVNRSPLVLLQQVAVNVAHSGLQSGGILAVNGPPGTGKTTLLRDIAAALVADRARAMSEFDDPESAFESSGERLKAGNGWLQLYRVDPRIRGFEMLVASSNNRAVENVTAELPTRSAVAADAPELNYFKSLSDELLGRDTWGLFAAVLGNRANRNAFKQRFWWSRDFGMATYLAAASGMPQTIDVTDPKTGEIESRAPRIVSQEDAPRGRNEALRRWQQSRQSFKETLARAEEILGRLDDVYLRATRLATLFTEEQEAQEALCPCQSAVDATVAEIDDVRNALRDAQVIRDSASSDQERRKTEKPGLIARIFRTQRYRCWREATNAAHLSVSRATTELNRLKDLEGEAERALDRTRLALEAALKRLTRAETLRQDAHRSINAARDEIGKHFIDSSTFQLPHEALHQLSPWLDEVSQRARDAVFIAAMSLHKAFIDAAAKPLRHNIGALMNVFGGANLVGATKEALIQDLWASLFLVVPVVSTTFASVERMLGALPPESFGWLLIDEAGQALPQAAVGALMRTKRAVVVGDPMQIEPIVVLPDTLTETICRRFGVDPTRFNAPLASAQTLADEASPYYAEFPSRHGDRTVGVPLLVHRRCGKPMFSIANAIAYEGLMVFAKRPSESAIREVLGKSQWFDVQGTAEEKWCPEEGEIVVELLRQLAQMAVKPNIYIVTPFVVVQQNLRQLIRKSAVLEGWVPNPNDWLRERIGTVHVVQGLEAEAVILVLGAPGPHQGGARGWAGGRPNLLNVAVTRAKEEIYVVGNRQLWREAGVFKELDTRMRMQNDQYYDRMRPAAR